MLFRRTTVDDCSIVDIEKIFTNNATVSFRENGNNISFDVKRVYYLYDVPCGETRGGHAHYELQQYIIAVSGSFDVVLKDGVKSRRISLNRPNIALHIVPGLWRELDNFSSGAISMVLASQVYEEMDYIRDYNLYLKVKNDTSFF